MESLTFKDTQRLHQSIQKLYTLRNLDTFGVDALLILNQLVPGDFINVHSTCIETRQILSTFLPDCPGYTSEMERVIHRHFYEHPIAQRMPQALSGVNKISDFISQ